MCTRPLFVIFMLILCTLGCGLFSNKADDAEMVFASTEVGTPEGTKITKEIGPAGGTLASPDGRMTLTVPQGALTETIAFSMQPITNKAGNGIGNAYRLEPDGKTFTTPLDISVRYDEQDLEGTVPEALSIAYQDDKGAWHAQKSVKLDQSAKTLTVSTTHFTDFAVLARLRMFPSQSTVYVGHFESIEIVGCKERSFIDNILGRTSDCSSPKGIASWKLRGEGTIEPLPNGTGVMYKAPAKKPTPNVAWVSVDVDFEVWESEKGTVTKVSRSFASKITIVDRGYRATGSTGGVALSGIICDLSKPFTVTGTADIVYLYNFSPASETGGTGSYSKPEYKLGATGGYTVEGLDTENPRIIWKTVTTAGIGLPVSRSRNVAYEIPLVPLESNEGGCGE